MDKTLAEPLVGKTRTETSLEKTKKVEKKICRFDSEWNR